MPESGSGPRSASPDKPISSGESESSERAGSDGESRQSERGGHPSSAGPYFTVDLHLHTNRGSSDSNLAPRDLAARAKAIGIGAACITEHDTMWEAREADELAAEAGVVLIRGMEVTTDLGHVGAFGLDRYVGGIHKLAELRRIADGEGGVIIANHPFRYRLDPRFAFINPGAEPIDPAHPELAARQRIFELVDAIEVLNGACGEEENRLALQVARRLGLAEVAGSDSHSASSIGCVTTLLDAPVSGARELIEAIRARRCRAGRGLLTGAPTPFEPAPQWPGG